MKDDRVVELSHTKGDNVFNIYVTKKVAKLITRECGIRSKRLQLSPKYYKTASRLIFFQVLLFDIVSEIYSVYVYEWCVYVSLYEFWWVEGCWW